MKGWYAYNQFTRKDNAAAREFFEQAIKIDPSYARAYAGLASRIGLRLRYRSGRLCRGWTDG